ncbi:alpha/beta fold hydrolase [Halobaculum gomorrense]|uniref:Pimeloyl-ACP methyl ester carboxylesterase n=1 Tax=Halobaculum gomorrense TaxID=43928 RepID=A0A1M5K8X1_9EURY|nr:alpha/beta hydrolase [Halobaculum gomorrense]SHG49227.1 Pimeloyl-ACP methyl ester carboxylesterase [Halobaculum gomorrense]
MTSYDEWTAAQDSTTVPVDDHDLEIAYRDEGEGDPVVFLHGIPTNSYLFRRQFEAVAADRRAIAPDMVGYGTSAMHDGFDRSIRAQEAAVRGLIDDLDLGTVDFVGHDLGGGVGLRLAARTPDAVDRLVLSNSVAYDSWPIQIITDLGLPESARENSVEDVQGMLDGLFRDTLYGGVDDAFVEAMKAPWASEEGVTSLVRNASGTNTSHTTEVDPGDVTADTLLLWGIEDEFQPVRWAERLERDIDSCELVRLEEANHWVPEDRGGTFRKHLTEFLLGGD